MILNIQKFNISRLVYVLLILHVLFVVLPFFTQAHEKGTTPLTPIVPQCSGVSAGLPKGACTLCDFFHLVQHIINFLTFEAAPLLVMIIIIIGGFTFLIAGGSQDKIKMGKSMMWKAVIGYVIVLTSWLIVSQILQVFTGKNFRTPWEISC